MLQYVSVVYVVVVVPDSLVDPELRMVHICTGEVCQKHTKRDRQQKQRLKSLCNGKIHKQKRNKYHYDIFPAAVNKEPGNTGVFCEIGYGTQKLIYHIRTFLS